MKVRVDDQSACVVLFIVRFVLVVSFAVKLEDLVDLEDQDPEITPGETDKFV